MIKIDRLFVNYGDHDVIRDLSLTINEGEVIHILGENGSGKSTLINCILGINQNYQGKITLDPKITTGYLPQYANNKTNFPITVQDVILTGYRNFKNRSRSDIIFWMHQMQLDPATLTKPMSTLSGGQKQRILFIRAVIDRPQLLMLDEASSSLDPVFRDVLNSVLKELNRQGTTIINVTHNLSKEISNRDLVLIINHHESQLMTYQAYLKKGVDHHV